MDDLELVVSTPAQEGFVSKRLSKVLKDYKITLEMTNNEMDMANQVACDAKAKVGVKLDSCCQNC